MQKASLKSASARVQKASRRSAVVVRAGKYDEELIASAKSIASPGRGILAMDESNATCGKRLDSIGVENTEANRLAYRELLVTTPGLGQYISGAILFEETLYQTCSTGKTMVDTLKGQGILPGIKVDKGLVPLANSNGESWCMGLDGLDQRCAAYYKAGARFAKWRSVVSIPAGPSAIAVRDCAYGLARYAAIAQNAGLVPIVEPEILTDGAHTIDVCAEVSERVFAACQKALIDHKIILEGCLLKPNMVTPGTECPEKATHAEIAWATVRTLNRSIVPAMTGVVFLSGGQSEEDASLNLNEMNKIDAKRRGPWGLSFSYGRALQSSTLKAWGGKAENVEKAKEVFEARCKANGEATMGLYAGGTGEQASLYVAKYTY